MNLTTETIRGRIAISVLKLQGDLDASSYRAVIARARELYDEGARHLLLDMSEIPFMGSSGLVALHSIAVMLRGEQPPDPEAGWEALHAIDRDRDKGLQSRFKLLCPQPQVERVLERSGLKKYFEIYADRQSAIDSF